MARANIDLSWLAGLLSGTPTAKPNPAFGAGPDPDFEGPVQQGGTQPLYDPSGNYVDPTVASQYGTTQPFESASKWQHMVHPEASQAIDTMNNQAASAQVMPSINNAAALKVRASNEQLLPPSLQPNISSPLSAAAAGYGSLDTSPSYINQQNQALLTAQHGLPGLKAATDLTTGKYQNVEATGALDRQQQEQSILNQDQVNRMQTVYGLTPQQIHLAEMQVSADSMFKPTENSIRAQALKNQQEQTFKLDPAQLRLNEAQVGNQQSIADQTARQIPYTTRTMQNNAVAGLAQSQYMPEEPPYGNRIGIDGSVTPFVRNPLGASPIAMQMELMKDITGKSIQTITLPSGKTITVQGSGVSHAPFNPLGTPTSTSNTDVVPPMHPSTIGGGSNAPSVTHDQTGSMSPPISSPAATTLPSGLALNGMGGYRSADATPDATAQLHSILNKYSNDNDLQYKAGVITPFGNLDKDALTDFLSSNASKMSKADFRQAVSLLHQMK